MIVYLNWLAVLILGAGAGYYGEILGTWGENKTRAWLDKKERKDGR